MGRQMSVRPTTSITVSKPLRPAPIPTERGKHFTVDTVSDSLGRNWWVVRILVPLLGLILVNAVGFWLCSRSRGDRCCPCWPESFQTCHCPCALRTSLWRSRKAPRNSGPARLPRERPVVCSSEAPRNSTTANPLEEEPLPPYSREPPPAGPRRSGEAPCNSTTAYPLDELLPVYSREAPPAG